jgi:hypothetical protein
MVDFMSGTIMAIGLLRRIDRRGADRSRPATSTSTFSPRQFTRPAIPGLWYLNEGDVTPRTPRSAHPSGDSEPALPLLPTLGLRDGAASEILDDPAPIGSDAAILRRSRVSERLPIACAIERLDGGARSALLDRVGVPLGRASRRPCAGCARQRTRQAMDNEFIHRTGMIQAAAHPDREDLRVLGSPIRLDGERPAVRAAPLLGSDSDSILKELGYDDSAVAALRSEGVV